MEFSTGVFKIIQKAKMDRQMYLSVLIFSVSLIVSAKAASTTSSQASTSEESSTTDVISSTILTSTIFQDSSTTDAPTSTASSTESEITTVSTTGLDTSQVSTLSEVGSTEADQTTSEPTTSVATSEQTTSVATSEQITSVATTAQTSATSPADITSAPTSAETTGSDAITTTKAAGGNDSSGNQSVIAMLGTLLALFMFLFLILFCYTIIRRRNVAYSSRAEGQAYDNTEMDLSIAGIEKIKETDISVSTSPLGLGRFGDIFPGQILRGTRKVHVAFKTLTTGSSDLERSGFMAQLNLYNKLEMHPHVIQFFGLCSVGDQLFAAFELASNGNLQNFLRRNGMPESESASPLITLNKTMLLNFAYEITLGMQHLALQQIVHRELMARHVLLTADCSCKVAGLNVTQRSEENFYIQWMAPESLETGTFTEESDIWSFGILLWEIMTMGGQPYPDIDTNDLTGLLQQEYMMPRPENCEPQLYDIMKLCWSNEPELRPPFGELSTKIKMAMETAEESDGTDEMAIDIEGLEDI